MSLSPRQQYLIETTERVSSVFSILGASFVIVTFLASPSFHKPVNRMVFYASWGNLVTNVATMISLSGIAAGQNSSLCQSQSFLIQMFMPADSLWTFCMACNVYLTFRRRFSADQLRRLEWKYFIMCYGIPAIPALTFLFVSTAAKGRIYGPATLWCWVSVDWDPIRIACFYGPVWLIFLVTILIYVSIGVEIYKKRRHLRTVAYMSTTDSEHLGVKTTEISVVSHGTIPEESEQQNFEMQRLEHPQAIRSPTKLPENRQRQYSVDVSAGPTPKRRNHKEELAKKMSPSDAAAWAYTKCAMLFFAALLITWVPSTINRVYTLASSGTVSFPLCYFEALVLPLQGFWNAIIYIATSVSACKELYSSCCQKIPSPHALFTRRRTYVRSDSTTDLAGPV